MQQQQQYIITTTTAGAGAGAADAAEGATNATGQVKTCLKQRSKKKQRMQKIKKNASAIGITCPPARFPLRPCPLLIFIIAIIMMFPNGQRATATAIAGKSRHGRRKINTHGPDDVPRPVSRPTPPPPPPAPPTAPCSFKSTTFGGTT